MASDSKEFAKMAEKMWGMLDTMASSNPAEYKKFIDQQMKEGKEHFSSPEGVYSLKCNNVRYRGNIYTLHINTATWNRVPYPNTDNDRIPVKGGTLRYYCSNNNNNDNKIITTKTTEVSSIEPTHRELIYDIAFNPRVIKECSEGTMMESMLFNLSLDFTEEITELIIDRKQVVKMGGVVGHHDDIPLSLDDQLNHLLPKDTQINDTLLERLSKMATTSRHDDAKDSTPSSEQFKDLPTLKLPGGQERDNKKPLIEVMGDVPISTTITKEPPYKMSDTRDVISVIITLKGISSVSEIDLEMTENELILTAQNQSNSVNYNLYIKLKGAVDDDSLKAQFNKTTSILTVQANKKKQ